MRYNYVGYTLEAGIVKGRVEADTPAEAREQVERQGFRMLEARPVKRMPGLEEMFPSLFKVKAGELARFSRQISVMIRGGSSIQRALQLQRAETGNRVMRRVLDDLNKVLDQGGTLSVGLARHSNVFTPRFISVVEAGEATGSLPQALDQMAEIMEREHEAKQKIMRTMMMPMFTIAASLGMLILMLTVLLPPLLKTFDNLGAEVPLVTRIARAAVEAVTNNMQATAIIIGAAIALYWVLKRIPAALYRLDYLKLKLPIMGQLIMVAQLGQFSRTVSMLLDAGVPLAAALPMGIAGCGNVALRRAFEDGEQSLLSGKGLSDALKHHPILPRMWVELVLIGEESNTLGRTMRDLADAYQKELESRLTALVSILEPLSTFMVGGVVLFIALSMFLPLYSGYDQLGS